MRPWLALLVLLTAAGSAGAQTQPTPVLRGAQTSDQMSGVATQTAEARAQAASVSQIPPPPPPPIAPPALMSMLPVRDPPACRPACAREYYFCLSGGDGADDCSGGLSQCVARCNRAPG